MSEALYDEAPDEPPTGGFPEQERRRKPRRHEDELSHRMESWVATLFVHRGKLVFLASILTFLFTSFGFRILGPTQDIIALDRKFTARDSIMNVRVTRIEDGQALIRDQLQSITESLHFIIYIQCTGMPRDTRPATCYAKEAP